MTPRITVRLTAVDTRDAMTMMTGWERLCGVREVGPADGLDIALVSLIS